MKRPEPGPHRHWRYVNRKKGGGLHRVQYAGIEMADMLLTGEKISFKEYFPWAKDLAGSRKKRFVHNIVRDGVNAILDMIIEDNCLYSFPSGLMYLLCTEWPGQKKPGRFGRVTLAWNDDNPQVSYRQKKARRMGYMYRAMVGKKIQDRVDAGIKTRRYRKWEDVVKPK